MPDAQSLSQADRSATAVSRLRSFLDAWQCHHAPSPNKVERLQELLRRIHPWLQSSGSILAVRTLPASRLKQILGDLSPALKQARGRGDAIDIWSVAGLGRDEVRTARVLAWLLDPGGSHGAGDAYLQEIWRRIDGERWLKFPVSDAHSVVRENYPLANGANRVDIEVTGQDFVLFIEVKIDARESKNGQILAYADLAKRKASSLHKRFWAVLYLSEIPPADIPLANFLQFRWRDVSCAIRSVSKRLGPNHFSTQLAVSFADHVERLHRG